MMKFLIVLFIALAINLVSEIEAVSQPVCAYKNSQDDTVFMKYFPLSKKGEEYVDFGTDGKCLKKAVCSETFVTEVEDCKKYAITCSNKKNYSGVFPACCVKC